MSRMPLILLIALIVLTVAGLGLVGAYFLLPRPLAGTGAWVNPVNAVKVDAVAADLAVLPLAGYPDERAAQAAMDAGEPETAFATLSYSVLMADNVRSGHWLLLASHFGKSDAARAAICYQVALDSVALSPSLGDGARADMAMQVTRGYAALGKDAIARLALTEAENIARSSLTLLPAQRRNLLLQVAAGYRSIGDTKTATAIQDKIDSASAGPAVKVEPGQSVLPTLVGSVVLSQTVTTALAARQEAAGNLAARWLGSNADERAQLAQALGQALEAEDAARSDFYRNGESLPLADRLSMLYDQVTWLTIKYQAARGAYGVSLVKDWEDRVDDIRTELATAYTDLINGYGQQLDTLNAADAAEGRVELLRQGLLWARLGLFSDRAEEALASQLTEASRQLWTRQGGAGLVIVAQDVQSQHFYLLAGSDTQPSN